MADPIWRNIQAPNLGAAISASNNAGQAFQRAVGNVGGAVNDLAAAQQQRRDNTVLREAMAINDPARYREFLAEASTSASPAALEQLAGRQNDLLDNALRVRQDQRAEASANDLSKQRQQQFTQRQYDFQRGVNEDQKSSAATSLLQNAVETSGSVNDAVAKISNADVPAEVRNAAMNLLYRVSPNARPGATLPGGASPGNQPIAGNAGDPASQTASNSLANQLNVAAGRADLGNLDRNYVGDPVIDLARAIGGEGGALEGTNINYLTEQIKSYADEFDVPVDVAAKAIAQGSEEAGFWNTSLRIPFTSWGTNPEIGSGRTLVTSNIENALKDYRARGSQRSAVSAEFLRNAAQAVQQAQTTYTSKNNIYRDIATRAENNPKLSAALEKARQDAVQAREALDQAQRNYSSLDSANRYYD